MDARMRPMARSLASFRAALLVGWGVLGLAGILYARSKGIPGLTALPIIAAFCIEYPFYLVPAFPTLRERFAGGRLIPFALLAALLPYFACCCGAVEFQWNGLIRLTALALAISLWYLVLPHAALVDLAFLALIPAVILGKYFDPVYAPIHPEFKDLRYLILLGHISLIVISVMTLMLERRVHETGYGLIPNREEWRVGALHYFYFLAIGGPIAWMLNATHYVGPKPVLYVGAFFLGMLWFVALSEEFGFRGVLQQWIEDWTMNRQTALVITSLLFGAVHLGFRGFPNWRWSIVVAVLGWFCGRARNQAGSIRASMVTHALVATTWRAFFA
jgi:uncharacterized protein